MGCTKLGHIHQWPTSGTLVIQRCEVRCNFCEGEASRKDWKYAWFLRRHVRAIHVKKGQYPKLRVDCGWDERNIRGTGSYPVKKEEYDDEAGQCERPTYISQPIYEEQKSAGMFYPSFMAPGELKLDATDAEFDFNDYGPFPAFANELAGIQCDNEFSYSAMNFHDFLDDATGGHGLLPSGTHHGREELDVDGLPIVSDYDLPEAAMPVPQVESDIDPAPYPTPTHGQYDDFFMSDYSNTSSNNSPLSTRPIAEILKEGAYIDPDNRSRVLACLSMVGDEMGEQGIDAKQLLTCLGDFTRLVAKSAETDAQLVFDSEGYALKPNPDTL